MKRFVIRSAACVLGTTAIALSGHAAYGATFSDFNFITNYSQTGGGPFDPTKDIRLDSVVIDGDEVSEFILVTGAAAGNNNISGLGPISSDLGDNGIEGTVNENPSNSDLVTSLGNRNLNSILDTEDEDNQLDAYVNVFFSEAVNHLFFFERGGNSDLTVQLIDGVGNTSGTPYIITRDPSRAVPGLFIDTREISGSNAPQRVVSYGLRSNSTFTGVRLTAHRGANGPDFKVVGANLEKDVSNVPAPSLLLGLGLMGLKHLKRRSISP